MKYGDVHEALLTRKDAEGPNQMLIFNAYNCVIRHHVCPDEEHYHTAGHGGDEVWELCARDIVKWEGQIPIRNWLMGMQAYFPHAAQDALQHFDAVDFMQVSLLARSRETAGTGPKMGMSRD